MFTKLRWKSTDCLADRIELTNGAIANLEIKITEALKACNEAERERCCRLLCAFCGKDGYNLIWHHGEWRHYRQSDMYVEWCQAAILRGERVE